MTDLNWEQQPGGLYMAVTDFDKTNTEHRDAITEVMRDSIQKVARVHGASFSETGFRNNMRAVYSGAIHALLFQAKWEICSPKSVYLGAGLNWNTIGIGPDGRIGRGIHTEDLCLLTNKIRELIIGKPKGKSFPEESLAECFERMSLQKMLLEHGATFRVAEIDPRNTAMMRSVIANGGIVGTEPDSAVLEFRRLPNNLSDRFPMTVELRDNSAPGENSFVFRWRKGSHDVHFTATKGQATAIGRSRVDIWPWHNGPLPEQAVLECVIASALREIKTKAEEDNWGIPHGGIVQSIPSPSIPLRASRSEILGALYGAAGNEALVNTIGANPTFKKPMPDAHIYVLKNRRMLEAFMALGAEVRLFGERPMKPEVNFIGSRVELAA